MTEKVDGVSNDLPREVVSSPQGVLPLDEPVRDRATRDASAVRAMAWTGAGKYAAQILRWLSTFLVARILSPEDYGLVGMTTMLSGLVALVAEFGVGSSVIRHRALTKSQLEQMNGLAVLLGLCATLVAALSAYPVAVFFRRSELTAIILFSSIAFFFSSFQTVPSAVLQRDTDFKTVAQIEFLGGFLVAAMVLGFALLGFKYWALVIPSVLVAGINALRFRHRVPISVSRPQYDQISEALHYSLSLLRGRLAAYFFASSDAIVAGRTLGSSALGNYSMAWDLANSPNDQINGLISRVSAPYFSELQNAREELARFFVLLVESVALISLPMVAGLALVSVDLIPVFFGEQWLGAIPILRILSIVAALRIITIMAAPLLSMLGDAAFLGRLYSRSLFLVVPVLVWAGPRYGTLGLAATWLFAYPILAFALLLRAAHILDVGVSRLMKAMIPGTTCTLIMSAAVTGYARLFGDTLSQGARLSTSIAAGVAVYVAAALLLFNGRMRSYLSLVRKAFS